MRLLLSAALLLWAALPPAPAGAEERKGRAPAGRATPQVPKIARDLGTADETQVKLAQVVIKTPTAELDPTLASAFLKLDVETLPAALRVKARGKQVELRSLISIAEGKKKGAIRMIGTETCEEEKFTAADIGMLLQVGFVEAQEHGVDGASKQTNCSEQDMKCQFTLKVIVMPPGSKPRRRYFFQEKDPMLAIVQLHEKAASGVGGQTNFFGAGYLACQK
jgi:hypothetical protein